MDNPTETNERQRILVVDNDLDTLSLLNRALELEGFEAVIVADSDSALSVLEQVKPDMVIMDTVTADGVDLLTLDSIRKHTDVPIIILTSDNEVATLKEAFARGADDFIRKPFGIKVLIARIKAKLRRRRQEIRPLIFSPTPSPINED